MILIKIVLKYLNKEVILMEEKKIESIYKIYNSLVNLLHNILIDETLTEDDVFYSLFGIVVLDIIFNKEDMVINTEGIVYESKMSDSQLEDILSYIEIENIDKSNNGASIYAIIRNKLAHGDYYLDNMNIIFNVNDKKCSVEIKKFINYYLKLTVNLRYRYKDKKFIKEQLVNKSGGKFNKLLETKEEILDYLKFLTYKEFIFKRKDNKELSTHEKELFAEVIKRVYDESENKEKNNDKLIKELINPLIYNIDIKNHKLKKLNDEQLKEAEKIINRLNKYYKFDDNYIENILYEGAENIYKVATKDYNTYAIKYGLANLKFLLNDMLYKNILDVDKYIKDKMKEDIYFALSFPKNEVVISIILCLIYYNYCYPLEKLYKDNKIFNININNDFDFSNLNLEELNVEVNNIYSDGRDKVLKESDIKCNSLLKKYIKTNEELEKLIIQKNNLIKKYKETKENKLLDIINNLTIKINNLDRQYEYYLHMYFNERENNIELNDCFKETNLNYYNYSIINGIRNSISHGNVKCNGIASENLENIELEFVDLYEFVVQFKLNIKVFNLFALIEEENLNTTNKYLVKKLNK